MSPAILQPIKSPGWLMHLVAVMGGGGLFVATFLDSSVITLPFIADALVINLSRAHPTRMPYYCLMAALGSLAGCIWIYWLAKKGGEAFFHKHARGKAAHAKRWVQRNAFLSVFIPGILPPPFPFKIFVLAEGAFQVRMRTFVMALLLGRSLRYFVEGILAIRYGDAVLVFLTTHKLAFVVGVLGVAAVLYLASHFLFRETKQAHS